MNSKITTIIIIIFAPIIFASQGNSINAANSGCGSNCSCGGYLGTQGPGTSTWRQDGAWSCYLDDCSKTTVSNGNQVWNANSCLSCNQNGNFVHTSNNKCINRNCGQQCFDLWGCQDCYYVGYRPQNNNCQICVDCSGSTWDDTKCQKCYGEYSKIDNTGCTSTNCSATTNWTDTLCSQCTASGYKAKKNASGCIKCSAITSGSYDDSSCSDCNNPIQYAKLDKTSCTTTQCSSITGNNWDDPSCSNCYSSSIYAKKDKSGCTTTQCSTITSGNWDNTKCLNCYNTSIYKKMDSTGCSNTNCSQISGNTWTEQNCLDCYTPSKHKKPDGSGCMNTDCTFINSGAWTDQYCSDCNSPIKYKKMDGTDCTTTYCSNTANGNWDDIKCSNCYTPIQYAKIGGTGCSTTNCSNITGNNWTEQNCQNCYNPIKHKKPDGSGCMTTDCTSISSGSWTNQYCSDCNIPIQYAKKDASGCSTTNCSIITGNTWNQQNCQDCYTPGKYKKLDGSGCMSTNCSTVTSGNWDDQKCSDCNDPIQYGKKDSTQCSMTNCSNISGNNWTEQTCQDCYTPGQYKKLDGSGCSTTNCSNTTSGSWTDQKCQDCNPSQTYAKSDKSDCTSVNCASYTVWDNQKCTQCNANKPYKTPDASSCSTCTGSLFLHPQTNQCTQTCPNKYFKNTLNNECTQCHLSCATCNGAEQNKCLTCQGSLYLDSSLSQCVQMCQDGNYSNQSNNKCTECDLNCKTCDNGTNKDCLSCNGNEFYSKDQKECFSECPQAYLAHQDNKLCIKCIDSCLECTSIDKCKTCMENSFLEGDICVSKCKDGFFGNKSTITCDKCNPDCKTCSGPSENECIESNSEKCNYKCKNECSGPDEKDCLTIQIQYQTVFHILIIKSVLWISTMIWGIFKDINVESLATIKPETPIIKEVNNHKSDNLKIQQSNRRPRNKLVLQQSKGSFVINNSPSIVPLQKLESEIMDTEESFIVNDQKKQDDIQIQNTLAKQSIFSQNSQVNKQYKTDQKLKYALIGNEWISIVYLNDQNISRSMRATLIFLKYQAFFYAAQQDEILKNVVFSLALGWGGKLLLTKCLSLVGANKIAKICFGVASSSLLFLQSYFTYIPQFSNADTEKDQKCSIYYGYAFLSDLLIFQQIFSFSEYIFTIKYLNCKNSMNIKSHIYRIFKSDTLLQHLNK